MLQTVKCSGFYAVWDGDGTMGWVYQYLDIQYRHYVTTGLDPAAGH